MKSVKNQNGMTLMEIMIVITIMGMVIGVGITKLGGNNRALKRSIRHLVVLSSTLHTKAKLLNRTFRIAIKMDEKEEHTYWVESSSGKVRLLSEEKKRDLERLTEIQREQILKDYGFSKDTSLVKSDLKLPSPLYFSRVEYAGRDDAVKEGIAYIHFFPQGLVEESAVYITDGDKMNWTVAFHPITGKAEIIGKDVPLKEIRQFEEF